MMRWAVRRIFSSSAIRPTLVCRRPAVSTKSRSVRRALAAVTASKSTAEGSPPWRVLMISTPARCPQTSSCSMAAARKVSAAQSRTVLPARRCQAASLPLVVVFPVPLTPTRKTTSGGAIRRAGRLLSRSRMASSSARSSDLSSAPSRMVCRRARSRRASSTTVVVGMPRVRRRAARLQALQAPPSSTSRVSATTSPILSERDSRGARNGVAHAVEYAAFFRLVKGAEEGLDHRSSSLRGSSSGNWPTTSHGHPDHRGDQPGNRPGVSLLGRHADPTEDIDCPGSACSLDWSRIREFRDERADSAALTDAAL